MKKDSRDTYKYVLKNGREIVYVGVSSNPPQRLEQHRQTKTFTHMIIVGRRTTRSAAETWERNRLATYRKNHGGNNPKFNSTNHG